MMKQILSRIKSLPILDPVERQMASLLQTILLGFMTIILLAAILNLTLSQEIPWTEVVIRTGIFLFVLGIPLFLLRRGSFRSSAMVIIGIFILLEAFAILSSDIVQAAGTISFFTLAIILAGLLVGRTALNLTLILCSGTVLYGALLSPVTETGNSGLAIALNFILLNGLIALFIDRFGITLRKALDESLSRENELRKETLERRKAEEELRESEARFRSLAENSVAGILISKMNGEVLYVNQTLANIFEYGSVEEFIQKNSKSIYKDPSKRDEMLHILRQEGQVVNFEVEMLTKTGRSITVLQSTRLEGDRLFGTLVDITERKKAEEDRENLIRELTAKNAELERFTYTVSHDLKSPLVTIKGFLGYLEPDAHSGNMARLKKDTARIANAVDKMTELLDDLLELSRIGRFINPVERVSFNEVVRQALDLTHGRIQERGVTVHVQRDLPELVIDKPRMVEVLQNLIDNAAKYSNGQAAPRIDIGLRGKEGNTYTFYVKDNGIGIAPEYHETVFKLFNKLAAETEGTGVGLALVKRIIEVHDGRIWVESELGKGATFYFTLPEKNAAK